MWFELNAEIWTGTPDRRSISIQMIMSKGKGKRAVRGEGTWGRVSLGHRDTPVRKGRLRRGSQRQQLGGGEEPAHRAGEASVSVGTQSHIPPRDRLSGWPPVAGGTDLGNGAWRAEEVK